MWSFYIKKWKWAIKIRKLPSVGKMSLQGVLLGDWKQVDFEAHHLALLWWGVVTSLAMPPADLRVNAGQAPTGAAEGQLLAIKHPLGPGSEEQSS